jgi:hypothetical protein
LPLLPIHRPLFFMFDDDYSSFLFYCYNLRVVCAVVVKRHPAGPCALVFLVLHGSLKGSFFVCYDCFFTIGMVRLVHFR